MIGDYDCSSTPLPCYCPGETTRAGQKKGSEIYAFEIRFQYRPPNWIHPESHTEEVEQFLAMLRFEQKSQVAKLPESLK